ncbi:MAG: aldehyde dehydrogenase family protein [Alphaproteobacteria bacterium]|nr:aldehyde dehydrogenase family protein [Alphaproteobacteria bacterium]
MVTQAQIDLLRHQEIPQQKLLINGKFKQGEADNLAIISPIDGAVLTHIANATANDVDEAVMAARKSYESGIWAKQSPAARKKILFRIAELIETQALELAVLGVRDNGTEIGMALRAEPGSAAGTFRYYAEALDKINGEVTPTDEAFLGMVLREPLGVVGAIVPWNFPLMIAAWKIAPALAMGNSVVLKPSEQASLSVLKLGEICLQAGLPEGVLNIVTGKGSVVGNAMAHHHDIDAIGFTGSGRVGASLMQAAAQSNLKRLFLELGGKSPNIIFADTKDLIQAAKVSANGIFRNSGEVCVAGSRLLVEESIAEEFTSELIKIAKNFKIGDPLDVTNDIGAVSNQQQLISDIEFVGNATQEGANLLQGGKRILQETGGFYMQPTIFTDVTAEMTIFKNEVFGPILTITPFKDEAHALTLANDSIFGLASAVWTENLSRAHRMIRHIKAGIVYVNTYGGADNSVPMAAAKQSGNGIDKSLHALTTYSQLKTAWIKLS